MYFRTWFPFLILSWFLPCTAYSQNIDEETLRETIARLREALILKDRLQEVEAERTAEAGQFRQEIELLERELRIAEQETEIEQQRFELETERTRLAEEQRDFYKTLYEQAIKKPKRKWWCLWICR
jgi:hypothetical protein